MATERPPSDRQAQEAASDLERRLEVVTLADLEAVRLLLRGGSVIDWHRLQFRDEAEVDRFLRVNEFDPHNELDLQRLEDLRDAAVEYLHQSSFNLRLSAEATSEAPARDLFLLASKKGPAQVGACTVLKVMHIIHHLAGRELLFRLPISNDEVFSLLEQKVVRLVEEIRGAGHPVVEFEWSRKPQSSLITKLLAKRSTLAASVYDKLRFRLVVRDATDLLPLLVELSHRLIPFNYVIPGESVNDLLPLHQVVEASPTLSPLGRKLQRLEDEESEKTFNEFSGPGYRIVNFVADVPIRLGEHLCRVDDPLNQEFGPIVFVLTEFQLADLRTAKENDQGENSHARYKARQLARVKQRLLHGLPPERDEDK